MPRRPRVDIAGYYHIINRGVEQRDVFVDDKDFNKFIELICKYSKEYNITIHNYSLMNNHYHLLIETKEKNLSSFMKQINMNYTIYFNKKYKRVGHLWQGRFKSFYVANEAYYYILMRYIEQNPIKAKIVKDLRKYKYNSLYQFLQKDIPNCLKDSYIVKKFKNNKKDIYDFLTMSVDKSDLAELKKASSLVEAPLKSNVLDKEKLKEMFKDYKSIKDRNNIILKAYKIGYSQAKIAKVLGLNQSTIQRTIKRNEKN